MMTFTRSRHPQPARPDPIQVVMLTRSSRALYPQSFASPFAQRAPFELTPSDVIDGEIAEAGAPLELRGVRRERGGRSGLRCLLPRPGVERTVCFGEFKRQLSRQLAHPERLRESHRLPCCVQLYRITIAQPRANVARRVLGVGAAAEDLLLHTPQMAQRLHLPPPPRIAQPQAEQSERESPWLAAGDEVVELRVIHDHTAFPESSATSAPAAVSLRQPAPAAAAPPPPPAIPSEPATKSGVPARFLIGPDFRLTREEALFDCAVATAAARGVFAGVRNRMRVLFNRGELRRWRALLDGEARDEQLWKVRPPKVALTDSRSRAWVHRTLTLAGYDAERMLREWELYWRRKGV